MMLFLFKIILILALSGESLSLRRNPYKSRGASLNRDREEVFDFYESSAGPTTTSSPPELSRRRFLFRQYSSILPPRSYNLNRHRQKILLDPVDAVPSEPVRSLAKPPPRIASRFARRRESKNAEDSTPHRPLHHPIRPFHHRIRQNPSSLRYEETTTQRIEEDPCLSNNHRVIANEPRRSFNHHLSLGEQLPICDQRLAEGWYRFESPAGNLLATECPGGNYCGTQIPVWMKGRIPSTSEGVIEATGCVNQGRECCTQELPMKVRNCTSFVVYHLLPTPGCHMGYCVGEGVPCPEGLASENGYTPCNFTAKVKEVKITQGILLSDVVLFCNPAIESVTNPLSVLVDVQWWVDDRLVVEENFSLKDKKVSTLLPKFWKLGQKIRCTAEARHKEVDARTEKRTSLAFIPGVQLHNSSLTMEEGGDPAAIKFFPTIPIICDRHIFESCCVEFQVDIGSPIQKCPNGEKRLSFMDCSNGKYKICQNEWNRTHEIPIVFNDNGLIQVEPMEFVTLKITTQSQSSVKWQNYHLTPVKIKLLNSDVIETCSISGGGEIFTFDGIKYSANEHGAYVLYKHRTEPFELIAIFQPCSLRKSCVCSIIFKAYDSLISFDLCTKRHLIVGGKSNNPNGLPKGLDLISINDGREYKLYLPTGTWISLDSYLLEVKIYASKSDLNSVSGLCGNFDRNPNNEFDQDKACPEKCENFIHKWSAKSMATPLYFNSTLDSICHFTGPCKDTSSGESILQTVLKSSQITWTDTAGSSEDPYRLASPPNSVTANVLPPSDGPYTLASAKTLCSDYIGDPKLDLLFANCLSNRNKEWAIRHCQEDVLHSSQFWVPQLYVERLKSECRSHIFRNATLSRGNAFRIRNRLCIDNCNENGECVEGSCICDEEHTGRDCSINVKSSKPKLFFLENDGLCDVRTNPCRKVAIISSGLDRDRILNCNFEIYKIRGVASKQLVNDRVFNRPGEFVSYQKLICPIPELDIHNPASLTNFDLKDNTDHTRLYIKISASYQGNGLNSAPLDLLLYDSSCWNCTKMECTAKKNDRCFFASGSSTSIQVFRLGKSVTTRKNIDDVAICTLPKDSGGCDNKIFRYYYNAIERRCKLFVYGGCKGNGNNFLSEVQCLQRCGDEFSLPQTEVTTEIDTCSQNRDEGICPGNVPRFYFDKVACRCLLFSYGGCGGNSNNFETQEECIARCGGPKGTIIIPSTLTNGSLKPRKSICTLTISRGNCQATLRRFYFDEKQGCKLFIFGGCQGNENNFETMEDCIRNCGGPNEHGVSDFIDQLRKQAVASSSNLAIPDTRSSSSNVCALPKDFGNCMTVTSRYYYDRNSNSCKKFRYSGCGGNENNFRSGENCVATCGGLLEENNRVSALTLSPFNIIKSTTSSTKSVPTSHRPSSKTFAPKIISISTTRNIILSTSALTTSTVKTTTSPPPTTSTTTTKLTIFETTSTSKLSEGITEKRSTGTSSSNNRRVRVRVRHRKHLPNIKITLSTTTETNVESATRSRFMSRFRVSESPSTSRTTPTRIRGNKEAHSRVALRRHDDGHVLGNVTRAEPSGLKRFPSLISNHRVGFYSTTPVVTTTTTTKTLLSTARSRTKSGFLSFLHKMRHKDRGKKSLNLDRTLEPRSSRLIDEESSLIDEVIQTPPSLKGSGLVVIRSFCRFPPFETDLPRCRGENPLYYYNVTLASCVSFYNGYCGQSRNRFLSQESCLSSCIVEAQGFATDPSNRQFLRFN